MSAYAYQKGCFVSSGLTAVQRSMVAIRKAVGAGVVDPAALSAAERRQHAGWLRREAENAAILALAAQGVAIKEIMRRTDKSRGLVRKVVRGGRHDMFRTRMVRSSHFWYSLRQLGPRAAATALRSGGQ